MAFLARMVRLGLSGAVLSALALGATGCAGFFVCQNKPACPSTGTGTGTGTGSTTGDYAYVSNSSTGNTSINGYGVSSGTLTAAAGSPYQLSYIAQAMVVTPSNSFLYVASPLTTTGGGIYGYTIGTGGALAALNSDIALIGEPATSLAVSPDGNYLFALNSTTQSLDEFAINTSSGTLSQLKQTVPFAFATGIVVLPLSVKVAPSGDFLVCVLGTAGVITFPYTASTGVITASYATISPPNSTSTGLYAAAVDANGYMYVSGTDGLRIYSTNSTGVPQQVGSTVYATGNGPRATILNTGSNYVYTANQTDGTITADAVGTAGVVTPISGSAFSGPPGVGALGVDSSGTYLVAAGYDGSSGVEIFSIGTAGALTLLGSAASGTSSNVPIVIAMTH